MTHKEFLTLRHGDVVKMRGTNIYMKVEVTSSGGISRSGNGTRLKRRFRQMFLDHDKYLTPKEEDIVSDSRPFLAIFNDWWYTKRQTEK